MSTQEPQGGRGGMEPTQQPSDPHTAPLAGCVRCEAVACPIRRHDRRDEMWQECWHDFDRDNAHALGDHRWCLPGDAEAAPDADPFAEGEDYPDSPDACRWAARWRADALAQATALPKDLPLGVVLLDPVGGPRLLSSHASYRTAGPHRTGAGKRTGDATMGQAKARAVVICALGHIH